MKNSVMSVTVMISIKIQMLAVCKKQILHLSLLAIAMVLFSGCMSYTKYQATSSLQPDSKVDLPPGGVKFRISSVKNPVAVILTVNDLNTIAIKKYPELFSDKADVWPLKVNVNMTNKWDYDYSLWSLVTFTMIPFPAKNIEQYTIDTIVYDIVPNPLSFTIDVERWTGGSLLGLIPVPYKIFDDDFRVMNEIISASIVEAVARQLKSLDAFNPETIVKVALDAKSKDLRKRAAEYVTDRKLLEKIAVETGDTEIGKSCIYKITDRMSLARIAMTAKNAETRVEADKFEIKQFMAESNGVANDKLPGQQNNLMVKLRETRFTALGHNLTDPVAIDNFLKRYPNGADTDVIRHRNATMKAKKINELSNAVVNAKPQQTIKVTFGGFVKNIGIRSSGSVLVYNGAPVSSIGEAFAKIPSKGDVWQRIDPAVFRIIKIDNLMPDNVLAYVNGVEIPLGFVISSAGHLTLVIPKEIIPCDLEFRGVLDSRLRLEK